MYNQATSSGCAALRDALPTGDVRLRAAQMKGENQMEESMTEQIVMELVVNSGNARSTAMEAIELAKKGKIDAAKEMIEEARNQINGAHNFQTKLIQDEIAGQAAPMSLIMCHGQDHLMTAMVVIDLAEQIIALYEKLA